MIRRQLRPSFSLYAQRATLSLLILVCGSTLAAAQQNRDRRASDANTTATSVPPTVTITPDATILTLCPEDAARAEDKVRLRSETTGFTTGTRYTWTTTGGRITEESDGSAVWDLAGVAPGAYTATLEVDNGTDTACRAFTSASIVTRPCAPVRVQCPAISISCPETVEAGQPVTLSANISGARADVQPVFNWTVSGGTIIGGQGTSAITVDTTGLGGNSFTANVQVEGFDRTCPLTATCTVTGNPLPLPRKFDEFPSISFDDDKARLDNFAVELQNEPTARGFIVLYPGRRSRADQASRLGERARRYLTTSRGIDASRLIVVSGAPRERDTYELYIVPVGATPPSVGR